MFFSATQLYIQKLKFQISHKGEKGTKKKRNETKGREGKEYKRGEETKRGKEEKMHVPVVIKTSRTNVAHSAVFCSWRFSYLIGELIIF